MNELRKAAKMALEALEDSMYPQKKQFDAIIDLRQALAQPEKEPMSFQTWRSRQHGDPEEIGFLQALKHAYESGQYSVSPPRKEWVGLTDKDWHNLPTSNKQGCERDAEIFNWIEDKLKEKNT